MNLPEQSARPALPDRARRIRWGYYAIRVLLVLLLLGVAGILPLHPRVAEKYQYRIGDIARERVVSPYDYRVREGRRHPAPRAARRGLRCCRCSCGCPRRVRDAAALRQLPARRAAA
jgi:hypothetical protein